MSDTTAEFDTESLARDWEKQAARRPRIHARIAWAARTDIGRVRENNEDKYDTFLPDDPHTLATRGRLWAVADGMGGHAAGQIASEAGLKTLIRSYFAPGSTGSIAEALHAGLCDANALLVKAAEHLGHKQGMGTTLVAAIVCDDQLTIAHIGDSRAYLLRQDERIRPLTIDHSWVEEQVRRGALSRQEAELSPYRNIVTRSLGMEAQIEPEIFTETLLPGDTILLASDGLTGYLDGDALALVLADKGLSRAALDLIDAANDAGGRDNSTVILLRVEALEPYPETD